MSSGGNHGRYLRLDLTAGRAAFVPLPDEILRRYIGGVGLGTWLLLRESPVGVDPLSPEAPLVFALGPLVGTPLTTSAKFAIVAKSPLTDRINDALSSSHFAVAAKRAGFDALVIVGACREPTALIIDGERLEPEARAEWTISKGEEIQLQDASDLWGLSAIEAERCLTNRMRRGRDGRDDVRAAAIGRAGENLVRFATISSDGRHAGRGGMGAVMGAKRLKIVAVRGTRSVPVADIHAVNAAAADLSARSSGTATEKYRELGTVANLEVLNRLAVLPTRNFQDNTFAAAGALSDGDLAAFRTGRRSSCAACNIACEHVYDLERTGDSQDGVSRGRGVRLEYESLFALGPLCGIGDPAAVLEAAALCDRLGLDTISAGGTIAFAMECAERGLLGSEHYPAPLSPPPPVPFPGARPAADLPRPVSTLSLRFGDAACVRELLRRIARRVGIGHLLAEGSRRAAAAIGYEAPRFAPHVKGLEIPGYEPRAMQAMALGYAVSARGADHNRSSAYEVDLSPAGDRMSGDEDTAVRVVETEDRAALVDSLILCKFVRGAFDDLFEEAVPLLRAVTGWECTAEDLREAARRIVAARKWFNEREGWTPPEDTLPERFLTERLRHGASAGAVLSRPQLARMVMAYNHRRGFTFDGHVPEELRERLGIF